MFRATVAACSLIVILIFTASCTHSGMKRETRLGAYSQAIVGQYDKVWRATQKALINYPIRLNNIDTGLIETDVIRGLNVWTPPHDPNDKEPGLRYFMKISLIRGDVRGKESVEVSIEKVKTIEKNFFAKEERLPSDGLEEAALLYRIERELQLERSLDKAFQRGL